MKLDLEALLTPISADKPAGESLRYSGVYEAVEEARREDDPSLPQGVWKTELKRADWREAARLCLDALETRAKDLQLAAWLLEVCARIAVAGEIFFVLRALGYDIPFTTALCIDAASSLAPA